MSALTAVSVLVSVLHAFLTPYLPNLITALTHPRVIAARAQSQRLSDIEAALTTNVPARHLLQPLTAAYDGAVASGAPVCATPFLCSLVLLPWLIFPSRCSPLCG